MNRQLIYQELAPFYDFLYSWKDYKKEAKKITALIKKYKASPGTTLLDVACGTGRHLQYLKNDFKCMGIDLNEEMIAIAKKNMSEVEFEIADMTSFNLGKKFDVITCLFSGIGCVKTYENVKKVLSNFEKHLNPGGVVIIEPWHTKSSYKVGLIHMNTYETKDLKVAQMNISKVKEGLSVIEMHYLIGTKNKKIKHVVDYDIEGLFEIDVFLQLMEEAGFKAKYFPQGLSKDDVGTERGLYIGARG